MIKQAKLLNFFLLLLVCALSLTGCRSMRMPASASFASVNITGQPAQKISDATTTVFHENGYAGGALDSHHLVFIKEASRMSTLAYDGLVAAQRGESTLVRVRVNLVELGPDSSRLQCQAFMVTDAGQRFEEETRLLNLRRLPYQKLLNQVEKRLAQ